MSTHSVIFPIKHWVRVAHVEQACTERVREKQRKREGARGEGRRKGEE